MKITDNQGKAPIEEEIAESIMDAFKNKGRFSTYKELAKAVSRDETSHEYQTVLKLQDIGYVKLSK